MQSSLDSILSIQVYPVKPCMEIYQVLVSHYHLFHINDMDIIPLSSIIYNENILWPITFSAVPAERGSVDCLRADRLYFSAQCRLP